MTKPKRWLSKVEVRDKVKLSFAEIARREKVGRFPKRLRLGKHRNSRSVWWEHVIDAWMDEEASKASADAPSS